jgi:PAS domain S-box-containing protein
VYEINGKRAKEYAQGIVDLATQVCKCPHGNIAMLDKEGVLVQVIENQKTTFFELDHHLIRQMMEPEKVHQAPAESKNPFYAGVPLINCDGVWIGALWVTDKQARILNKQQQHNLLLLGAQLINYLEIDHDNQALLLNKVNFERFNDLFNYSSEIHCITDGEGRIKYINDSIYNLLGYPPREVMDKTIWDFCVEGERDRVMPYIVAEISQGKDRFQIQTRTLTKTGELRWFEWSDVIKDDYWLINGRDITDRKQVESHARVLTLAVEKSSAGVFIRNVNNELSWMNQSMEHMIGYSLEELKGKPIAKLLIGKESDLSVFEYAVDMVKDNKPYQVELKCYKKDGTPVWLFMSNTPLFNEFGELEQYVGVAFDITSHKEAEAILIKTREDAISLSHAKENFLSVMSHELRTPLNGVIGASRILAEEEHLKHQEETLNILKFSSQNLLTLINDVLDFTKMETGNMSLESEPLDLRSLVDKTIHSLVHKAKEQGTELSYEFDERIPNFVYGDHTRLYQILINLLGNAVKFTSNGYVKVQVKMEEEREDKIAITFQVIDSGIGIAPDKLEAIFDAYTQAGAETSRKYGGTGLGLAITEKLIQLYGAEIKVTSTLGEGSNFYFTITFKKCDDSIAQAASTFIQEDLKGHVLVVDDSSMNRVIAQKILSKWKLSVDLAEDGLQALEKIESNDYDLILMDIHMPGMDGFETVRVIREKEEIKYKDLPIIALTGSVYDEHDTLITEAGMNDYILKPFDADLLYKKIKKLLG